MTSSFLNKEDIERMTFESIDWYSRLYISKTLKSNIKVEIQENINQFMLALNLAMYGYPLKQIESSECIPDGWYQALKDSYFPEFIKKMCPVKTKTIIRIDTLMVTP